MPPPAAPWPVAWGRAQARSPRSGSSWGLLGHHRRGCTSSCCQGSKAPSSTLAAPQPDYKFLKGKQCILYIFPVSIWCRGEGKKRRFGLAAQPEAENVIHPHPWAASSFLITRGRHSGIAFKRSCPPSCLGKCIGVSRLPTLEGQTHVHWCTEWDTRVLGG